MPVRESNGWGEPPVPRGTMDEVSSHVRLDLPSLRRQGRPKDCSASFSNPILERPSGADFEEKREPVSDIDTVLVDSLKALDPNRPIREADINLLKLQR